VGVRSIEPLRKELGLKNLNFNLSIFFKIIVTVKSTKKSRYALKKFVAKTSDERCFADD
jgi:hypothetical protein